jgi:hypothetical protein
LRIDRAGAGIPTAARTLMRMLVASKLNRQSVDTATSESLPLIAK